MYFLNNTSVVVFNVELIFIDVLIFLRHDGMLFSRGLRGFRPFGLCS